jgi:hypothetical protein
VGAGSPYLYSAAAGPMKFFRLRSGPFRLAPNFRPGGPGSIAITGVPGLTFIVQASTNLVDWVNLSTNTAPSTFVDFDAANYRMRMYRVILAQAPAAAPTVVAPSISAAPQNLTAPLGRDTVLSVSASGPGPFSYQWRFNGNNIAGATASSLPLSGLQFSGAGLYSVAVSNAAGVVVSPAAVVNVAPQLTGQLANRRLALSWPSPFILQSASQASGLYADVSGAASPFLQDTAGQAVTFFRLRSEPFSLTTTSLGNGQASIAVTGAPGWNFVIQASTDSVNWLNLQTNTAPCTFVDTAASGRIYRAVPLH